jgi:DNA-binding FadR family transcriptional regulator
VIKRSETIAEKLCDEILAGTYKPGERLPAERDLAHQLGANRGSVREALLALERMGLVTTRRGDGHTVRPLREAHLELAGPLLKAGGTLHRDVIEELLDTSEALLAGAIYLAVERASQPELDRVRRRVLHLADDRNPRRYHERLGELIELVADVTGNLMLRLVRNTMRPATDEGVRVLEPWLDTDWLAVTRALAAIDAALAAHDPSAAEQAMRALYRLRRQDIGRAIDAQEESLARGEDPLKPPA